MSGDLERWFGLDGQVAIVTGGTGVLGSAMAAGLAAAGARVAVLARRAPEVEDPTGSASPPMSCAATS